jgi:hypothetical protein
LRAQAASKLTHVHSAIAALHTLLPPQLAAIAFDNIWCNAACGESWKVDIDAATWMRAHVTTNNDAIWLTLRSAAPLPRRPLLDRVAADGRQQEDMPAYRVVIEAYDGRQCCHLGFVPSHLPKPASLAGGVADANFSGWTVMQPRLGDAADGIASDTGPSMKPVARGPSSYHCFVLAEILPALNFIFLGCFRRTPPSVLLLLLLLLLLLSISRSRVATTWFATPIFDLSRFFSLVCGDYCRQNLPVGE